MTRLASILFVYLFSSLTFGQGKCYRDLNDRVFYFNLKTPTPYILFENPTSTHYDHYRLKEIGKRVFLASNRSKHFIVYRKGRNRFFIGNLTKHNLKKCGRKKWCAKTKKIDLRKRKAFYKSGRRKYYRRVYKKKNQKNTFTLYTSRQKNFHSIVGKIDLNKKHFIEINSLSSLHPCL